MEAINGILMGVYAVVLHCLGISLREGHFIMLTILYKHI